MRKHYRQFNVAAAKAAANWTAHLAPSFSRLRESTLLPFCYLRESANGDLSPKMANPCGGKAAGNFRRQWRRNTQPHFPILLCKMVCATRKWQKCGDNRLRDYVAAIAAMDSRSRENDGDIKSPSS